MRRLARKHSLSSESWDESSEAVSPYTSSLVIVGTRYPLVETRDREAPHDMAQHLTPLIPNCVVRWLCGGGTALNQLMAFHFTLSATSREVNG